MIIGHGIDIEELSSIQQAYTKHARFAQKVLSFFVKSTIVFLKYSYRSFQKPTSFCKKYILNLGKKLQRLFVFVEYFP